MANTMIGWCAPMVMTIALNSREDVPGTLLVWFGCLKAKQYRNPDKRLVIKGLFSLRN